jgi:predicted dehydrogenase
MTTPEEPLRTGVFGVGNMGSHHARVYGELQDVDLVGVHDADDERAERVATDSGTTALPAEDLLDRVDALSVAVPTEYHFEVARRAIERDVAVLVEKPIAATVEEGRRLVDLADERSVPLAVGHTERFNPAVRTLADVVADLDVVALDARRLGPPLDRTNGESVALDLMIHDLDVALSLVGGEPTLVEAAGARDNRYVSATVRFDDVVGSFRASRLTQRKVRRLVLTAEECTVTVDYIDRSVQVHRRSLPAYVETDGDLRYRHESVIERPFVENGEPLAAELRSFVETVRTGATSAVTGEDGLRALSLARTIDERATERRQTAVSPSGTS